MEAQTQCDDEELSSINGGKKWVKYFQIACLLFPHIFVRGHFNVIK